MPIKLQIFSKLEYKSDAIESATGMLRTVWFPFMDCDLKVSKTKTTTLTHHSDLSSIMFQTSSPALLLSVTL